MHRFWPFLTIAFAITPVYGDGLTPKSSDNELATTALETNQPDQGLITGLESTQPTQTITNSPPAKPPISPTHAFESTTSKTPPPEETTGTSAGLFVGVSRFDTNAPLQVITNAVDDAIAAAFLFVIEKQLIPATNAWLAFSGEPHGTNSALMAQLTNAGVTFAEPTHDNIIALAEEVSSRAKDNGLALVLMSTHGFNADTHYFLMPQNARRSLTTTGVSAHDLVQTLDLSHAKRRVLILDSCRTDAVLAPAALAAKAPNEDNPAEFLKYINENAAHVAIIYSCEPGHKSYNSSKLGAGIFTHFFLEALRSDDNADNLGVIRLDAAIAYTTKEIQNWCANNDFDPQTPGFAPPDRDFLPLSWSEARRKDSLELERRKLASINYITNTLDVPMRGQVLEFLLEADIRSAKLKELIEEIDLIKPINPAIAAKNFSTWWLGWYTQLAKAQTTVIVETVPPKAKVTLDNQVSQSPATFTNVTQGSHNLIVQAQRYETVIKRINVRENSNPLQRVNLKRLSGELRVWLDPDTATFSITTTNGKPVDTQQYPSLLADDYTVALELPGWTTYRTNITIEPNQTTELRYAFPSGVLRLTSNLNDVQFWADGRLLGSEGIYDLPPGNRVITAVHGSDIKQEKINLSVNSTNELSIGFPPKAPEVISVQTNKTTITLIWQQVDGAERYCVYTGTNPAFSTAVLLTALSTTNYTDEGPRIGEPIYYWLTSANMAGHSPESAMKNILIPAPNPPLIIDGPTNTSTPVGDEVLLTVRARGIHPWYRWEILSLGTNWISDSETNSPEKRLQTTGRNPKDAVQARVVVSDTGGAVTSRVALINLTPRKFTKFILFNQPDVPYKITKSASIVWAGGPLDGEKAGLIETIKNPGTNRYARLIRWGSNPKPNPPWKVLVDGTILNNHGLIAGRFSD